MFDEKNIVRTNNLAYAPELDHVRFLAAFLVFMFHGFHYFYGHWQFFPDKPWIGFIVEGHTGVSLFFTLSGYLFMLIALGGKDIKYTDFMRNRFLRIFPLFLLVFYVSISISRDKFAPADILYLFFSNIGHPATSDTAVTGAAWTISIEFTFYMLFPFLAHFAKERGPSYLIKLVFLLGIFKLAAYFASEKPTLMFYSTLLGRLDQFLIGMFFAQVASMYTLSRAGYRLLFVFGTVGIYLALALASTKFSFFYTEAKRSQWIYWTTAEAFLWGCLITGYHRSGFNIPELIRKFLSKGGEISYSFYMLHLMVIYTVEILVTRYLKIDINSVQDMIILSIICFILTFLLSILSYNVIEKPFLSMRKRYVQ